jgi:hypothetical protein
MKGGRGRGSCGGQASGYDIRPRGVGASTERRLSGESSCTEGSWNGHTLQSKA